MRLFDPREVRKEGVRGAGTIRYVVESVDLRSQSAWMCHEVSRQRRGKVPAG